MAGRLQETSFQPRDAAPRNLCAEVIVTKRFV